MLIGNVLRTKLSGRFFRGDRCGEVLYVYLLYQKIWSEEVKAAIKTIFSIENESSKNYKKHGLLSLCNLYSTKSDYKVLLTH